jgi:16S rRNA (guanine1207-N2)-methyltransferase
MNDNALDTLLLPFEKGILPFPDGKTIFHGARNHRALAGFKDLAIVQSFYPYHAALTYPAAEDFPTFDTALVLLPKQKEEAQRELALALGALKPGGMIIAAASNDAGGNRIEGWMSELGLEAQSLPKNKARVCWAVKKAESDKATAWIMNGMKRSITIDGDAWVSQPGVFGWNRADEGSKLLLQHIPNDLKGSGADFGCGYGYLTRHVLKKNKAIDRIVGIDADARAVECARENITDVRASFIWGDLVQPVDGVKNLGFIVMNPPFHEGKTTVSALGKDFIRTAHAALKTGGMLYMVANAHLDYESVLKEQFAHGDKLAETKGFKVYRAVK